MPVTNVSDFDELSDALKSGYSVVDFWATWCKPCKDIAPQFVEMSDVEDFEHIKFYKCDIADFEEDDMVEMGLEQIPAFFVYKDGEKIGTFLGNGCLPDLKKKMEELS